MYRSGKKKMYKSLSDLDRYLINVYGKRRFETSTFKQ